MNLQRPNPSALPPTRVRGALGGARAFTLIELILVMSILVVVISVTGPSLTSFFRGRTLDSEAHRFIALTRYAQSRAVAEGIPMLLWIDTKESAYGVVMQPSYSDQDDRAKEFALDGSLQIEVGLPPAGANTGTFAPTAAALLLGNNVTTIRYTPDGFIDQQSPETISIRDGDRSQVIIAQSRTRLNYEVQPDTAPR